MTASAWLQLTVFLALLLGLAWPLGAYLARVYTGEARWAARLFGPLERLMHRASGVDPREDMTWKRYALRHAHHGDAAPAAQVLVFDDLTVDLARREVSRAGGAVHLTPIEYKLLLLFAQHAGKVLTHRHILKEVWGPAYATQTHYVRVHMAELRKKVEADPSRPKLLVTEPGVGYRLRDRS